MVDATDLKSVEPEQLVRVRVSPPPLQIYFLPTLEKMFLLLTLL